MAILLSVHKLKKTFGARPLFDGLTFSIESGERIGLIGPNGAGKSTLLSILAGRQNPDEGDVAASRGLRVGYLEQVPQFTPGATILETVMEGASTGRGHDWENISAAKEQISRLELDRVAEPEFPVEKLSGGWKKRVALARELVKHPDLLLLDEPTNHLDVESVMWLEQWLARSQLTTMTITHDRLFLQRVSNRILEIDARNADGVLSVRGDYAAYLETKGLLLSSATRREEVLKNTLRRETEWLRRGAKARTTKQQARINRHGDLTDEFQDVAERNRTKTARLDFETSSKLPKKLIDAKAISKAYGDRKLFGGLNLLLGPGTRLGLLGANGSGKTTLIRVLLGLEQPDTGSVTLSDHLEVSYFSQNREALDPGKTVAQTLCPRGEFVEFMGNRVHIRSYLDRFLFTASQMDMPIGRLSGGEQSRVLLAQLMLQPANVLVLDEPTNDLDLATLSVLEECLQSFEGAIILVSHDRYFLDQVSSQLLAFEGDQVISFADLSQWEAWRAAQGKNAAKTTTAVLSAPAQAAPKKRLGFKEQRELDGMEAKIHETEAKLAAATEEMNQPENSSNATKLRELSELVGTLQESVNKLYARWQELLELQGY